MEDLCCLSRSMLPERCLNHLCFIDPPFSFNPLLPKNLLDSWKDGKESVWKRNNDGGDDDDNDDRHHDYNENNDVIIIIIIITIIIAIIIFTVIIMK